MHETNSQLLDEMREIRQRLHHTELSGMALALRDLMGWPIGSYYMGRTFSCGAVRTEGARVQAVHTS
jgi:hypothetical protein